ncbi:SDR family oxidoreductase [Rhabdothermincola salaria]|uniref:SDR family oxidoreductase n=1 Tax=Rhabdothermincola salaria TaxID=2903142 RepID=UPI001E52D95D|nr:SDR family oxidoreductase [Rhabdothermincola salaria]MCD9624268.1 SDR family oxidoreductase [Rhabdothermincola salaria]
MDLIDKVVVVTGGGSGIGAAMAVTATEAGARHVVVADRDGDAAASVADAIGGTATTIDVRDEEAIVELVRSTESAHGGIDLFCSNAGFVTQAGVEESDEVLQAMWDVHVMSHIHAARAVLPSMIDRGEGYLLNTASAAGLLTQIGSLGYTITKHAAVALAEWLSITHHHQGIRVSVLCPQAVRTNITANSPDVRVSNAAADDPLGVPLADGVVEADAVARLCVEAIAAERFWVLPHPEVADYVKQKSDDIDRWLAGMRRYQARLYGDRPLPGDRLVSGS